MEEKVKKINLITYGCSYNQATSEIISGLLLQNNFVLVKNPEQSDIIIILSCVVKDPTQNKVIYKVKSLYEKFPSKKIIVGGCLPEVIPEKITAISSDINLFGPHHATEIVDIVKRTIEGEKITSIGKKYECKLEYPRKKINPIIGIIQISQGCKSNCSYCCVKFAMGNFLAYPVVKIKQEVVNLLKNGCKEIWITAQDTAAYDYEKCDLPDLLDEILEIQSQYKIRVGMMNPKNAKKKIAKLVNTYKNEKIYKFLHLPLQSGDDEILNAMNRGYSVEDFRTIVNEFRSEFPKLTLSTDLIVGFPGENEDQFKNSLKMLEKIKPDIVNISRFGPRPKTAAKMMEKKILAEDIKKRSKIATELVNQLTYKRNNEWLNWEGEVLISEKSKYDDWIGRNYAYKPVVIKTSKNLLGKYMNVYVDEATAGYLIGHLI